MTVFLQRSVLLASFVAWGIMPRGVQAASCCPGDVNNDHVVTVDEIVLAVNAALNGCAAVTIPCQGGGLLRTGQVQCDQGNGSIGACPGSPDGQDGSLQAGTAPSYTDNGDGTITDNVTGLIWEKLSDDRSVHDFNKTYSWYDAFNVKIATLNTPPCFTGNCDWRLPNRRELESLVDVGQNAPAVDPVFHDTNTCTMGCTVTTCSCTASNFYWSSTTFQDPSQKFAWAVDLGAGRITYYEKTSGNLLSVRAVRGGI